MRVQNHLDFVLSGTVCYSVAKSLVLPMRPSTEFVSIILTNENVFSALHDSPYYYQHPDHALGGVFVVPANGEQVVVNRLSL